MLPSPRSPGTRPPAHMVHAVRQMHPAAGSGFRLVTDRSGSQRIPKPHRLRAAAAFTALRAEGRAVRGAHCLVVVQRLPGEPTQLAFVASRRVVGDAVRRNRARRRLREIVRRRWPRVEHQGFRLMFVAFRSAVTAPHAELARDVERLLVQIGALREVEG